MGTKLDAINTCISSAAGQAAGAASFPILKAAIEAHLAVNGTLPVNVILLAPCYAKGELLGYAMTMCHHTDVGGYGIGARMLWDRVPQGADPLGPENMLGMFAGVIQAALQKKGGVLLEDHSKG